MNKKEQLEATIALRDDFNKYMESAHLDKEGVTIATMLLLALNQTIEALANDSDFLMDEELYNKMFLSIYLFIGDKRALQYVGQHPKKKTNLA